MAYYTINTTAPQARVNIKALQDSLIIANDKVDQIMRQLAQMTDEQASAQYGVSLADVPAFRTVMLNVQTALDSAGVVAFTSQVGFSG